MASLKTLSPNIITSRKKPNAVNLETQSACNKIQGERACWEPFPPRNAEFPGSAVEIQQASTTVEVRLLPQRTVHWKPVTLAAVVQRHLG